MVAFRRFSRHSGFEVDHLISRELGGGDIVDNLRFFEVTFVPVRFDQFARRIENVHHSAV
jgi:hypothetical protein